MTERSSRDLILWFFLGLFLISIVLLGWLLWPFISVIVIGAVVTGVFTPVYQLINRKMRASFASLLTCLLIFVVLFVPIVFIVTVVSGEVTVTVDPQEYEKGQVIIATITNGLEQTIYAEDMKTGCTLVVLELQNGDDWESLRTCAMELLPFVFAIDPGMGRTVIIDPRSDMFGLAPGELGFGPGNYRINFFYRFDPAKEGDEPYSSVSSEFLVVP